MHIFKNVRSLQVKELFKAQRDELSRAALSPDAGAGGGGTSDDADDSGEGADDARSMAVAGTLKTALRAACTVTAKI